MTTLSGIRQARRGVPTGVAITLIALLPFAAPTARAGDEEDTWAIRCVTVDGADRVTRAENAAEHLRHVRGLKEKLVRVLHDREASVVYYGEYELHYSAFRKEENYKPDPEKDLKLIRSLSMEVNDPAIGRRTIWPFSLATLETLPIKSDVPPEWQLINARGTYSLQVAVFYNTDGMRQRKTAAEQYCKMLRDQGEEAYFDHGAVHSSVTIGAFPEQALQTFERPDPMTGRVQVVRKIVDEKMLALQKKYPHNMHNGRTFFEIVHDKKTGKSDRVPHTSFPVLIPTRNDGFGLP